MAVRRHWDRTIGINPARRSELFPVPLGPYSTVKYEVERLENTTRSSRSRPKKIRCSDSEKGLRPTYGALSGSRFIRLVPLPGRVAQQSWGDRCHRFSHSVSPKGVFPAWRDLFEWPTSEVPRPPDWEDS